MTQIYQIQKRKFLFFFPKKSDQNNKITEKEYKILFISSALTAFEDKISNLSNLVEKRDYGIKFTEIEKKLTDHDHDKDLIRYNKI